MDMKLVYSADGPSVTIASHDVSRVKAAIVAQTLAEHFLPARRRCRNPGGQAVL
jgi:hypothetical protein